MLDISAKANSTHKQSSQPSARTTDRAERYLKELTVPCP
jgi:hypothetical protein